MKTWFCLLCLFVLLISFSGCAYYKSPVVPPLGFFSNVQVPVDVNFEETAIGPRVGEAQTTSILGLFAFGDCSAYSAAKKGNIKRIDHIEHAYTNILGIVTFYKIKVYGE